MRLTGSFQTIVTHGLADWTISSGVRVGSTSTGAVTGPCWHTDPRDPANGAVNGTAHRPLRAHHAPGRPALRRGAPPIGLRALPPTPPGGTAVRRGGRRRTGARRDRGVPVRRRRARRARGRRGRPHAPVAGRLPLLRRRLGIRRGRGLLPLLAAAGGRGVVRRGGAPRDAAALDLQPRL